MKSFKVAHTDITVSSIVLGLMRIAKMSDSEIRALVVAAVEAGVTMIDHADVYGGAPHVCEGRLGEAVKLSAADRGRIMIQSKAGIRKGYFDFSSEHILEAVDGSLKALKTENLDVLLLPRPDTQVEPDDVAKAFDTLHAAGKVRHFGVSDQTPGQIELLKSAVKQPLLFNQVQLSIAHANLFAQGIAANVDGLDQSISRAAGLPAPPRLNGMTLQAGSPVQHGFL